MMNFFTIVLGIIAAKVIGVTAVVLLLRSKTVVKKINRFYIKWAKDYVEDMMEEIEQESLDMVD